MTTEVPRRDLGRDAGRSGDPGQDQPGRPACDDELPSDDELTPPQMAAMQSLDDALRAGLITADDFRVIELVVRRGHVAGARKRLTEARRRHRAAS